MNLLGAFTASVWGPRGTVVIKTSVASIFSGRTKAGEHKLREVLVSVQGCFGAQCQVYMA